MADEIDRGQERGEVARADNQLSRSSGKRGIDELGISWQRGKVAANKCPKCGHFFGNQRSVRSSDTPAATYEDLGVSRQHAANDTQADCLRMIIRAEMRMADEIDRGQARGEVARLGTNQTTGSGPRSSGTRPATLDELGVSSQRVAEWRQTRDAGEQVVEQAINAALAEGARLAATRRRR